MADNRTWAQKQEDAAVKMQEARALQYPQLGAMAKDYASLPGRAIAGATDTAVVRPLRAMGLDVPYTPRSYYGPQGDASQMFPYMAQYAADLPANTAAAAERLNAYQQKVDAERAPTPPAQAAISETPVATSLAAQQQQPAARGAVPPGFVTEMRGLQTSYYNPETQVRAPTTAAAEVLSRPAPKTFDEYLQRVAATAEDPKSALAAISQMEANRVRQNAVQAAQIRARETQINDMRAALKEPMLDKETRARYIQQLPIMEAQLLFSQGLLTEDALNSLFSKPATAQKKANGGLVGFANGGEVDMQDTPDMPMAIDPTAAGKSAGMESGDYVFPVEAVQFYGLKMLKDMVKKAMMAD